jgi:hypothetical protein
MRVLSDDSEDSLPPGEDPGASARSRWVVVAGVTAVAVVLVAAMAWWWSPPEPAQPKSAPPGEVRRDVPAPSPPAPSVTPEPSSPARPSARRERAPREKPEAPAPAVEPAAPAGPSLVVDSDVAGASVFLNRKYLGTTPLRTAEVTPGSGQLHVSAEGYDGVARTIEVGESGVTEVTVRLKEVRLDASVAVVHKHGMGSCEGTLRASVAGLRYETSNEGDAFALAFGQLETFTLDYLQKALKVKQRGGKTWNFTTKDANADALFVFHRDVEKARQKLAAR